MALDYVTYCTAEGDAIILQLQCARYLIKRLEEAMAGQPVSEFCDYLIPVSASAFNVRGIPQCTARTAEELQDPAVLLSLFSYRALLSLCSVGQRLRQLLQKYSHSQA